MNKEGEGEVIETHEKSSEVMPDIADPETVTRITGSENMLFGDLSKEHNLPPRGKFSEKLLSGHSVVSRVARFIALTAIATTLSVQKPNEIVANGDKEPNAGSGQFDAGFNQQQSEAAMDSVSDTVETLENTRPNSDRGETVYARGYFSGTQSAENEFASQDKGQESESKSGSIPMFGNGVIVETSKSLQFGEDNNADTNVTKSKDLVGNLFRIVEPALGKEVVQVGDVMTLRVESADVGNLAQTALRSASEFIKAEQKVIESGGVGGGHSSFDKGMDTTSSNAIFSYNIAPPQKIKRKDGGEVWVTTVDFIRGSVKDGTPKDVEGQPDKGKQVVEFSSQP